MINICKDEYKIPNFQEKHNLELKFENTQSMLESEVRARERAEAERDKLRGQLTLLKELILNDQECYCYKFVFS